MAKNIHVVPHKDGWATKREGSARASKVFDKKTDAVSYARKVAKDDKSELIVHSKSGKLQDNIGSGKRLGKGIYGNDPNPTKVGTSGTGAKNKKGKK